MLSDRLLLLAALATLASPLTGCADPDAAFQEFADRYPVTVAGPAGACGTTVQEIEGEFFFALSVRKPYVKIPIVFKATLRTEDDGLHMTVQALDAADRKTPVGDSIDLPTAGDPGYAINEKGEFTAALPELAVVGKANPISGGDILATITLTGTVCEDLLCGAADGAATKPIMLNIDGSTFTMERVTGPDDYPEPPTINCNGDLAKNVEDV